MVYSKEQFRQIFQNRFDYETWKAIVKDIFKARMRNTPERFTEPGDAEDGYYAGVGETPDSYKIGYFIYKINSGSVAHKKVGLRNLVKRFINQNWGEFDAAIVVFNDGKEWRLSFVCDIKEEATAPKRFTFVFGERDNFYRTAIERFSILQSHEPTFENIRKAFSVDALSDDFFDTYREMYADFVQYITGKRYVKESNKWVERELSAPNYQFESTFDGDAKLVRDYIKKMFGRIVFLYFLQRKGWLDGNRQYMHDLFANSTHKDDFLDGVLEPLFFDILNTDKPYRTADARALPGSENIPYLNGGLFAKDDIDDRTCVFPAEYFGRLFDFLDSYNFTIDENDSDDAEIGIDPEMLGRIFENLLEDNKDKGAFYTPKEIVDYMCRESIIAYLLNDYSEDTRSLIRHFVETLDASQLSEDLKLSLRKKLQAVKICDPAIGSGAFPMGLVNLLSKLYVAMKTDTDTSKMKRYIMEQNIYGVDIEQGAVDIARLRFWLAMIVEEKEPIPLPNLHFKIMQGNSLLESYKNYDLTDLTKISGQTSLFDSDNAEREALIANLQEYYKTSDHQERDRLFNEIINNVRRQLFAKGVELPTGVDPSANMDFFLWHTWFADVFAKGGFDIVIGNPPYGAKVPNEQKKLFQSLYPVAKTIPGKLKGSQDTFVIFINLSYNILKSEGICSMIVPMSITGAKSMESLHNLLKHSTDNIYISSYGDRPRRVFDGAEQQVSIIQFQKTNSTAQKLFSTTINKRFSDEPFSVMLDNLEFVNVLGFVSEGRIPKIGKEIEVSILKKLLSTSKTLKNYYDKKGAPIFYRKAGGRYYKIIKTIPTKSSAEGNINVMAKYQTAIASCLASNIFYWFWLIHSDWHNLRSNELEWFPIPFDNANEDDIHTLSLLYIEYEQSLNANSEITSTGLLRFFARKSKPYIDKIDDYLGKLYELTEDEIMFIKNFDSRYRVNEE